MMSPHIVTMLSTRLKAGNYKVIIAYDALQAKMKAIRETPDLIITDINMPGGGGFNIFEVLKRNEQTALIPILIITGITKEEFSRKAQELGIDGKDIFYKPFDSKEITARIKDILGE